ncbi:GNAT family N-acetyltransferase [Flavisolibacter tropicus]|uniref:Alanine acetyltransferase n=1 Tax=Flavisolibacter tropicus TaxID=1492898 RepID=A0A172TY45_9BACT|nr:GNAT family protein [Flavisolibacter tropicus]ANE51960.1 alanine acetyltransferase [Flavisolibacter tropicus]
MTFEILETSRLKLRKLTPEVFDFVFTNYTNEELKTFFGLSTEQELEKERIKHEKGLATYNKSFLYFQLIDKSNDTVIGGCGYHTWYLDHFRAEIGYGLFQEQHKGKGLMTEALLPIIDYGFNTMHLNRIEALIGPENTASLQLVKRLNFTREGYLRQHYNHNGQIVDSVLFSLLRSEYKG